jgi:carbonic anhydrase
LTERFRALGIERHQLPENLTEFFDVFASERQNVIRAVEFVRQSPLIGPKIPVQGLLVNVQSGQLEWVVNGYDVLARPAAAPGSVRLPTLGGIVGDLATGAGFNMGEMKFPETKIGEIANAAKQMFSTHEPGPISTPLPAMPTPPPPTLIPPIPPPPTRPRVVPVPPPIQLNPGGRDRRR